MERKIYDHDLAPIIGKKNRTFCKPHVPMKFILMISILLGLLIVLVLSFQFKETDRKALKYYKSIINDIDYSYFEVLQDEIKADNIRQNLKEMTKFAHLAGTKGDYESAAYIHNKWLEQNLDYVKIIDYNVLLSYPDNNKPNNIQFLNKTNDLIESIDILEPIIDKELNYTGTPNPFLAYAVNGSVTSDEIYYVNYCTESDFLFFAKLNLNFNNKPVICRYGQIFRGDKVIIAEKFGASAVILYDDPQRSASIREQIYPNGEFLPEFGTQRGTLFTGSGDPTTPLYPSLDSAFRVKESLVHGLPKIPAQVIGYEHALKIFKLLMLNEKVANESWSGGMNVTYTYGGKLTDEKKLTINVFNKRTMAKTYNVIGMIKGEIEQDRCILVGNHRDAWVFGSVDPTGGTAALLEISRAFSALKKNHDWKPRRSIIFLSWGAEEYGLVGSTEWIEEFNKKLSANGVAYLNLDVAVQGNYSFTTHASPLIHDVIFNITKNIKQTTNETVYDRWLKFAPNRNKTKPFINGQLGAGSDHMAFQQRLGIPCMDSTFSHDKSDKYKYLGSSYALYHTNYETFNLVDKIIDPGFNSFRIISLIIAETARILADSLIISFNAINYFYEFNDILGNLKENYGDYLNDKGISLTGLERAIKKYETVANNFNIRLSTVDPTHIFAVQQFNEQMRNIEKSFLNAESIGREGYMNVISAPSLYNQYASDGFPALNDAIYDAIKNGETDLNEIRKQLSIVIYAINSACTVLDAPDLFERY